MTCRGKEEELHKGLIFRTFSLYRPKVNATRVQRDGLRLKQRESNAGN